MNSRPHRFSSVTARVPLALSALSLALASLAAHAAAPVPPNLGPALRPLVERHLAEVGLDAAAIQARREAQRDEPVFDNTESSMIGDEQGRILVGILVAGGSSYDAVRAAVARIGGVTIQAEDRHYRAGIIEVLTPVASLVALARVQGVSTVQASMRPVTNVGSVTQQGVVQHRVDKVSQNGAGVTIGILSDSYNTAQNTLAGTPLAVREAQDIATGDLPGPGNPAGNTQPVVVLQDLGVYPNTQGFDEGRGMAQLIHDVAPKARLGFATAFGSEVAFANNIRALAGVQGLPTSKPDFAAQIIVDDVQYFDEGMFADTIVAQAVDDVTALGVSYFSSAGNTAPTQGYASDVRIVPVGANPTAGSNIDLTGVPAALYAGGFHNFRSDGGQDIAQKLTLAPSSTANSYTANLVFQWDDKYDPQATIGGLVFQQSAALTASIPTADFVLSNPTVGQQYRVVVQGQSTKNAGTDFDAVVTVIQPDGTTLLQQDTGLGETLLLSLAQVGQYTIRVSGFDGDTGTFTVTANIATFEQISSDFNLLFFRPNGTFINSTALATDSLAGNRPLELANLVFNRLPSVQMVIARANIPTAARPAQRLRYKFRDASFPAEYFSYTTPITYGHNSAAGANGVAAYSPFPPNIPEDFTSTGPVRIVYDRNNNLIPDAQQVRLKPNLAAMDGGNTTFFVSDTSRDADAFPNFFGTSAAAPNAAAIAALVLQKNGGPGAVTPAQMRAILQSSTFPHDLDFYSARGQAVASNGGQITVTIEGDDSTTSQIDPNATTVSYSGPSSIARITFDASTGNPGGGSESNPNQPGLVFDTRVTTATDQVGGGQPFVFGWKSVGLRRAAVTASYFGQAPLPSLPGQFYGLQLDFVRGAFVGGNALRFGIDRDEQNSAFPSTPTRNGSSADLAGSGVRIPAGTIAPGGIKFSGTLADGATFQGVIQNRLGAGYSGLDGYGFINAESAVAKPLP